MTECKVHRDVSDMLRGVLAHVKSTGEHAELYDEPRNLRLGFSSPSRYWVISLARLKESCSDRGLLKLFSTPDGRREIAESLNRGALPFS